MLKIEPRQFETFQHFLSVTEFVCCQYDYDTPESYTPAKPV
jgi:hypothetical protein